METKAMRFVCFISGLILLSGGISWVFNYNIFVTIASVAMVIVGATLIASVLK